jgi:death-on-curing protein
LPNEPRWLPADVVTEMNRAEVLDTGENHFLRDFGLLDSALARPRNAYAYGEEDVVVLAVTLMAGIARAHAFEQGNKGPHSQRCGCSCCINGYDTAFEDTGSWADEVIALVEHRSTEEDFVRAIRPYVVTRP